MDYPDSDNSNMFKVDHSDNFTVEPTDKRTDNFFHPDKKILDDTKKRIVVYGTMEQKPKTVYEVIQPYLFKAAQITGEAATTAGKGIFNALATGMGWLYDKFVNTVIPYTKQEIPKLLFVVKNQKKQKKIENSQSFHVLEIDEKDYETIKRKENKNTKKRVIVPLGPNEDPQFIKFLEREKFVPENSFPIDVDEQDESFMIPSANFMVIHNQAIKKNLQQQKKIQQSKQSKQEKKIEENVDENQIEKELITSIKETPTTTLQVEDYKRVGKKIFKLKDCFIFELEGKNSIQYDLLDGIERDDNTKCGFLLKSTKLQLKDSNSSQDPSGEVPLIIEKQFDLKPKVRVEIPKETSEENNQKKREIYYA